MHSNRPNLIAVHMAHLTEDEIELLAQQGCSVAHCPSSNLKLASGLAPVVSLLDRGVNVGLGTDGAASNNRLDMFEEMAECSNIQAIKESTRDITNITRTINRFGDRYKILGGVDTLSYESLCAGADGMVAGLVDAFPRETVAIYRLVKAGRHQEALKIYRWFLPVLELDIHPKLVQYIKLAATQTGIGSEYVRAPRLRLTGKEREDVLAIINEAIQTRPVLQDYLHLQEKNVQRA